MASQRPPEQPAENTQQLTTLIPRNNLKGIAITIFAAIICIIAYRLLPFDPIANKGLTILLFVAILWFTEAVHITITALSVPILAAVSGIPDMNTKAAFSSFADPIIFIFFGGFALATAMHIQKLDRKIAMALIAFSKGRLLQAVLMIFAVTAFLSMWISNTATAAMILPLALGLMSHLDKNRHRKIFTFVLLGIAYSASIGGLGTLVGSPPNAIAAKALNLDFIGWLKLGLPIMLLILPLMLAALYIVLRPNFHDAGMADIGKEDIPWTPVRILTMAVFVLTALAWIFSSKLKAIGITSPDAVIAVTAAIAVVALGLASWRNVADNTDWGVLMLFGGGIALSGLLKKSGASEVLGHQVATAFVWAHPFIVILAVAVFIIVLTEFTSNTASAALLVPIFASIATQMGLPKEVLVMIIGIGASCAFSLPVATPPNAIAYGTGLVAQRDMMRVGMLLNAGCIMLISVWAYFIWR